MPRYALHLGTIVLASALAACATEDRALAPPPPSLSSAGRGQVSYQVVDLGTFDAEQAQAFVINDAGTVAGRYYSTASGTRSFSWDAHSGMRDLGEIDGMAFAVLRGNNRGDLVGWVHSTTPGLLRGVLRTRAGDFQYIDGVANHSVARGINEAGVIVGEHEAPAGSPSIAFVLTRDAGLRDIPRLGDRLRSGASSIDNAGHVIGWTEISLKCCSERGFIWDAETGMTLLPSLGGSAFPLALNAQGDIVGHSDLEPFVPGKGKLATISGSPGTLATHAFFWSKATGIIDLGTFGGRNSIAWSVGPHHDVYGWAEDAAGQRRAFRWTAQEGKVELPGLGGTYSQAGAVNARGMVASQAADEAGVRHAIVLYP